MGPDPADTARAREVRDSEESVIALILDLDRTLTPEQRAHAVKKFASYADDCLALARDASAALDVRDILEAVR